jgi:hypothetical protein
MSTRQVTSGRNVGGNQVDADKWYAERSFEMLERVGAIPGDVAQLVRRAHELSKGANRTDGLDAFEVVRLAHSAHLFDPEADGAHVPYLLQLLELPQVEAAAPVALDAFPPLADQVRLSNEVPQGLDQVPVAINRLQGEEVQQLARSIQINYDGDQKPSTIAMEDVRKLLADHAAAKAGGDILRVTEYEEEVLVPQLKQQLMRLAREENADMAVHVEVPAPGRQETELPSGGLGEFRAISDTRIWDRVRDAGFDAAMLEREHYIDVKVPEGQTMVLLKMSRDAVNPQITQEIVLTGNTRLLAGDFDPGEYRVELWKTSKDRHMPVEERRQSASVYLPEIGEREAFDLAKFAGCDLVTNGERLTRFEWSEGADVARDGRAAKVGLYLRGDADGKPIGELPDGAKAVPFEEHAGTTVHLPRGIYRIPDAPNAQLRVYSDTLLSITEGDQERFLAPMRNGFGTPPEPLAGGRGPAFLARASERMRFHITPEANGDEHATAVYLRQNWNGIDKKEPWRITLRDRIA